MAGNAPFFMVKLIFGVGILMLIGLN